jgi:succinate-acetate transporter protein
MVVDGSKSEEAAWPFVNNGTIWKNGNLFSEALFSANGLKYWLKKVYFVLIKYHLEKNAGAKTGQGHQMTSLGQNIFLWLCQTLAT